MTDRVNKMPIYVPSMGRAGVIFERQTTATWIRGAVWVVPSDEVDRYARAFRNRDRDELVMACPARGIAETRRWIGESAMAAGHDRFLMCDDDLMFAVRKSPDAYNLRPAAREDIDHMLAWTAAMLQRYAHVSVSPRANNAGIPRLQTGTVETLVALNKRTLRYLAYRTKEFLAMKHGRVTVMEDFDVNLQLLRAGHQNATSYWFAQDQRETGSAGGCSAYRTREAHDASARRLAELHAPFVTLRTKVMKQSLTRAAESMRERLEVTIYWEKAWESSQ